MEKHALSVLMPNYNHARFLPDALDSILAQSRTPDEIIVIDDCSTDGSIEVLERYRARHPLIRIERNERNMGVIHCLNRLLELAAGDFVYYAAADDMALPGFFERCVNLLARHPEAGLCSALVLKSDEDGGNRKPLDAPVVSRAECYIGPAHALEAMRAHGSWIVGTGTIYRRDALADAGGFSPELGSFCDGFAAQVIALRRGACFIPASLAVWRQVESGYFASTGTDAARRAEIMRHAENLMRTTYRDLFPDDYIDLWKRAWRYETEAQRLKKLGAAAIPAKLLLLLRLRLVSAWTRRRISALSYPRK